MTDYNDLSAYAPLLFLIITIVGGLMCLAEITPVAQPPHTVMIGRTSGSDGLPFGVWSPVTTPPGPLLTRTMPSAYRPQNPPPAGRLYLASVFTPPAQPVFEPQSRTTVELEIVRG